MWIRSQNGEELLEVKRIRIIPVDEKNVNILAKLERETVILGTYHTAQADSVMVDLEKMIQGTELIFKMPKRWIKMDFEKLIEFAKKLNDTMAKTKEEEQK